MSITTRVFMNGNSQAVRIPQQFRLDTGRVEISRNADGDLILRRMTDGRGEALLNALAGFDADFVAALESDRAIPLPAQDREDL